MIAPSENNTLRAVVIAHIKNDFPVPAVPTTFKVKADQIEIRMSQWKIRLKMSQKDLKSKIDKPKKAYQCQSASQIDVYSSRLDVRDQLEGYPFGKTYLITMQTGTAR